MVIKRLKLVVILVLGGFELSLSAMGDPEVLLAAKWQSVVALADRLTGELLELQTMGSAATREWARYATYETTAIEQVAQEQLSGAAAELVLTELTRHRARNRVVTMPESGATGE